MKKFKNIFGTKENKKAEAQAKAESLVEQVSEVVNEATDLLIQNAINSADESLINKSEAAYESEILTNQNGEVIKGTEEVPNPTPTPSPDPLPAVAYEFEFDIVEYPSKLIETIKVIGRGTNEDECLRNAADTAKEKLKPSQHLRYTQKSLKQIAEGLN